MINIGSFILGGAAAIAGLMSTLYAGTLIEAWLRQRRSFQSRLDDMQSNNHKLGEDIHKLHTHLMKATNELEQLKRHVLSQGKEGNK